MEWDCVCWPPVQSRSAGASLLAIHAIGNPLFWNEQTFALSMKSVPNGENTRSDLPRCHRVRHRLVIIACKSLNYKLIELTYLTLPT